MVKLRNLNNLVEDFQKCTENPTLFLKPQPELEENVKSQLKSLYDFMKKFEDFRNQDSSTLRKLITDHFDSEQIWQQLEIQNKFAYNELEKRLSVYLNKRNDTNAYNDEDGSESDEISSEGEEDEAFRSDDNEEDLEDEEEVQEDFQDEDGEMNSEIEEEGDENDFEDGDEKYSDDEKCNEKGEGKEKKVVRFNLDDSDAKTNEKTEIHDTVKSSFEKRQERLETRVQKLEEEILAEKPWQLKGETTAKTRPENSLLEEYLEFDVTSRPAPIITEEAALKLEDVILQRIKDKAWDDVERKIKPVDTVFEFKKKLVLDQEKSKLSLAKIYEQEYLKQKDAVDPENKFKEPEEPREHTQIRNLLDSLFHKLDSLSNYHYTPIPAAPELQVVNNLPAVTMEEAIPDTVSNVNLLAPEEIHGKKSGDLMGKEERTSTDKKRSRRKKKLRQRLRKKAMESREKQSKQVKVKNQLEKLVQNSAVSLFKEDESNLKASKSSKQFFEKLQDTVTTGNKVKRKKENVKYDAKKIKL